MEPRPDDLSATSGAEPPAGAPPVSSTAMGTITGLDPSLYVPQDLRHARRVPFEVDDAINIIEDGEHVSAEDFGLSSTEISMSAPISMNVGMELNAMQQIDAFLRARPAPGELVASQSAPATQHDHTPSHDEETLRSVATGVPVEAPPAVARVSFPSRRDEKVLQLESHPIVKAVAPDGRSVLCKCGKDVRLNPPWYIIKYEQHLVSRNCTFLRKKKSKRDQAAAQEAQVPQTSEQTSTADEEEGGAAVPQGQEEAVNAKTVEDRDASISGSNASVVNDDNRSSDNAEVTMKEEYRLESADILLKKFACPITSGERTDEVVAHDKKAMDTLRVLATTPYFSRITPDGRFVECVCSELTILSVPWELREFQNHVDAKGKPQAPARRKNNSSLAARKPRLGDGAAHRLEQRLIARETRWKPVSMETEVPCPGVRGERVSAYISSTTKLTGGSRARRRIAEDLFPHKFVRVDGKGKSSARLNPEEKLLLRDAVESEAVWFVDHDANAVRSLDCRGSMAANKGEVCCASCFELKSNTNLRIAVTVATGQKRLSDNPLSSGDTPVTQVKRGGNAVFALLEQEFDMSEEYARILRDLFRADVEENSVKNMWFDMAELGISGLFASHPTFMGLLESMMARKEKERRGVGLQNMAYSDHLDTFMKSLSDISSTACDFFQEHLGGRKQKYLLQKKRRKTEAQPEQQFHGVPTSDSVQSAITNSNDTLSHLSFDFSSSHDHGVSDMQVVDLSAFQPEPLSAQSSLQHQTDLVGNDETEAFLTDENLDVDQEDIDDGSVCSVPAVSPPQPVILPGYMPCRGLRDSKVQAYVTNAVQMIGGSRPKYVIAKELFPEVFNGSHKVKITEKLTEEERGVVLDAIFSECLWRVDRTNNCVRSLRCFRRVDRKRGNGVCRACLELKGIANFRSVLCRAKVPKKVENLKYVPSVYTESDPFMRKLSKNASLRMLYQTVKKMVGEDKKKVTFWLRLAKMGLFGQFRSHTVFEGLIASMVETKDRERRGVGKQNMLYAKSLDEFMGELATISMDAFELFSHHFCGRTSRSQKIKKRKALTQLYGSANQEAMSVNSAAMASSSAPSSMQTATVSSSTVSSTSASTPHAHSMMMPEELLGASRPITTAEMEESQRFMDRMLDEVRLSVNNDDHEQDEHLDTQTYLDENGVLTTVL